MAKVNWKPRIERDVDKLSELIEDVKYSIENDCWGDARGAIALIQNLCGAIHTATRKQEEYEYEQAEGKE